MAERPHSVEWIRQPAETDGSPEGDPKKASFRWKNGDSVVETQDFTEEELEAQVRELERSGDEVPAAFREALAGFREGSR